ncbi:MAG: hypothetical protein ABWU84_05460, partial [Pyrobaculum sp.]
VEKDVKDVYPPFLKLDVNIEYVNGTYSEGVLQASNRTVVVIWLKMEPLLPIEIPAIVSVAVDDKVALLYDDPPTSVSQVSGTTVYYWSVLVRNTTVFKLALRVRQFGSFGAVKMPAITVTSALDLNNTINTIERQIESLRAAEAQLSNFSKAATLFTDLVYGQAQNLTQLIQILNVSGIALRQGAVALNASTYALEALRRQLLALGDAASGVATTLNQSLLLVDYQYTALITAANLLEVQSSALSSYSRAASDAAKGLGDIRNQLYNTRGNLVELRRALDSSIENIKEAKKRLSGISINISAAQDALKSALAVLDSAEAQLRSLRASVDALISTVDSLISITDSTIKTINSAKRSLDELAPLLNQTAVSTRGNATRLREDMPKILLNASRNLVEVSQSLYQTGDEVAKLLSPVHNASRILHEMGIRLEESAKSLEEYRLEQLKALPRLGAVRSLIDNYTQLVQRQIRELELQQETLRRYYGLVNVSRLEAQYVVELPVAVENITIPPPRLVTLEKASGNSLSMPTVPLLSLAVGVVAAVLFLSRAARRRAS